MRHLHKVFQKNDSYMYKRVKQLCAIHPPIRGNAIENISKNEGLKECRFKYSVLFRPLLFDRLPG